MGAGRKFQPPSLSHKTTDSNLVCLLPDGFPECLNLFCLFHTHAPYTHRCVGSLSLIFAEVSTDLGRPPYSHHPPLAWSGCLQTLQGPGLSRDPEPDGACCPICSPPPLLRGRDEPGEAGSAGGPQEGVPKGEGEKTQSVRIFKENPSGRPVLPFLPPSFLSASHLFTPAGSQPLIARSDLEPCARRSRLALKACRVCV